MTETKHNQLCLVMLGKTGHGKSSSANTIMQNGAQDFESLSSSTSVTQIVRSGKRTTNEGTLFVYDIPGEAFQASDYNEDKGKTKDEVNFNELERTLQYIKEVLNDSSSKGNVSAFLVVFSFGTRFTKEETSTFDTYKKLLGQSCFSEFVIFVFTHGDKFENDGKHSDLQGWCNEQSGFFKDLYQEVHHRVVLMYNTTEDRHSEQRKRGVDEIIRYARQIKSKRGSYDWEKYQLASESRRDIYLAYESLVLTPGFEKEFKELDQEFEGLKRNVTEPERQKLLIKIGILKGTIKKKKEGRLLYTKLFDDLKNLKQKVKSEKKDCMLL